MIFHQVISLCRISFVTVISSVPELGHVAIHDGEKEKVLRKRTNRVHIMSIFINSPFVFDIPLPRRDLVDIPFS